MHTAYLVDDEALILDELMNTIPWLDNGFEVVGCNTNPINAIIEIESLKPDVVFCDLRMLEMDGNELIRQLKSAGIECEFVMISAFNNYDNVRAFFQQAGFDYVLKPVQLDDIQMVLERLSLRLKEKRPREDSESAPTDNRCFNSLLAYIDNNFSSKITLEMLAKQFGFSKNYICNLFSKYYGSSLTCYLTEKRMDYAKILLKDKNLLLKDIAKTCGYGDYVQFYKVFKEYYGISPKEMAEADL